MGYVAEVSVEDDDLNDRMSRMRTWLDHRRYEPASFRFGIADGRPKVRVSFKVEREAAAFVTEFGGTLLPSATTDAAIS